MSEDEAVRTLVAAALAEHPEQVARIVEQAGVEEAVGFASEHPNPLAWAEVVPSLSSDRAERLLESLPPAFGAELLQSMDPPAAAALLSRLEEGPRNVLLDASSPGFRAEMAELLSHRPETAGHIMDPRVLAFPRRATIGEVLSRLRVPTKKRIFEVFAVGDAGELAGTLPLQDVAVAPPEDTLEAHMRPPSAFVQATATREEVVEILEERKLPVLPVVDLDGRLLGAIRYDALLAAAQEEASADLLTMVGASKEERALSRVSFAVRKRLPWLEINLATAFLAAAVVGLFESTIAQFTALAVLLPVVAGQSGNTGAQALAVTMRGLALREIRTRQWFPVLFKEVRVGLVNGIAVAVTTSFFVFLWSRSVGLAAVIFISMIVSMAIAGLAGGAIPLILVSVGQDPAQSSSIILTTVTDVVGFFSFLGIATLLSGML